MKIVGIDYGHGETSAGYVDSDLVLGSEIKTDDLNIVGLCTVIPSIICKMATGEYVLNPEDSQLVTAQEVGLCFKAPLVGSKLYPEITDENRVFFRNFIKCVYNSIVTNENNPLHIDGKGNMDYKVYIACPSGWNETQIQLYKEFFQNECSVPIVDIIKESRAAYIATRRKVDGDRIRDQFGNVLVIDFGSSTVDFTYFDNNTKFEPVHWGYPLGASRIENDVLDYMIQPCNTEAYKNYQRVIERCGETRGRNILLFSIRKQKEQFFSKENPQNFNPSIHLRDLFLDRTLTNAYIEPSDEYQRGYPNDILENVILKDYKKSLEDMLDNFVAKEGVSSIDKVILTGGASRMYFFKKMVQDKYGVSKKENTLIVDLNPSLSISEGIAAFGLMNEKSNLVEEPLKKQTEEWISNNLPFLLKKTIEKCLGDMYYDEFCSLTKEYAIGNIVKGGNHNLYGLEDKFIELLNTWVSNADVMSSKIVDVVQASIIDTLGQKLAEFARAWGFQDAVAENFNIHVNLEIRASLTPESCRSLLQYIWDGVKYFISNRDFWGWDDTTSPFKNRRDNDRESICNDMNKNLRSYFNDLNYISPLDDEVSKIANTVREKLQNYIDNAKLQQYR